MRLIRLGRKNSPKQQMIIVVVAVVVILLLHISDFIPVTAGQLAEKYHLQINEISYYEEDVLIWEKEVFGNFSILETGELGSVRHAFYPKGMKHQELYESLLEMGK